MVSAVEKSGKRISLMIVLFFPISLPMVTFIYKTVMYLVPILCKKPDLLLFVCYIHTIVLCEGKNDLVFFVWFRHLFVISITESVNASSRDVAWKVAGVTKRLTLFFSEDRASLHNLFYSVAPPMNI